MKGIQFIVDDTGEKTAVVIDLKQWGKLWENFYKSIKKTFEKNESWLHQSPFKEELDQALEWDANNPPQITDLDLLESQLNHYELIKV